DLGDAERRAYEEAYHTLADAADPKLLLATYFGTLEHNLPWAASLPAQGLHVDLVRAPDRKSTRLNSSHVKISYAVFCLKQKSQNDQKQADQSMEHSGSVPHLRRPEVKVLPHDRTSFTHGL